ncbi:thermonuclease family protein [Conexibacter sp. SYSU D00693]|uniref:thermonuclease family protein n=1 Tax=Conexibacter sp. SYSU D00693 TaxID=2812560 RepID=UPI00196A773D|nr:thermonuclease family protein [Conexibacter sp. SYSU D00693]
MRRLVVVAAAVAGAALAGAGAGPATAATPSGTAVTATDVVDGATLVVRVRATGRTQRVRLVALDVPRIHPEGSTVECGGLGALDALLRQVFTKPVDTDGDGLRDAPGGTAQRLYLQTDTRFGRRDKAGRTFAYLARSSGQDVGGALLSGGWARVTPGARSFRARAVYAQAQTRAQGRSAGVWGGCEGDFHVPGSVIL